MCESGWDLSRLENDGYWGMNIVKGDHYTFRLAARATEGFNAPLKIGLCKLRGKELASGEIKGFDSDWEYYSANLTASGSDPKAHLEISGEGNGKLYLDMVSLMPDRTWKNHGLRIDLAEALDALHPTFLRFPGGCWVEGDDFAHMNHWKNTIGNIDTRTPLWNHLGLQRYPWPWLSRVSAAGRRPGCRTALLYQRGHIAYGRSFPLDQMGQWVQDALDAIEYANGPVNSVWGSLRAKNGHPKPFNLKYLEIGNENGQAPYAERWALMANAIHAKYPEYQAHRK